MNLVELTDDCELFTLDGQTIDAKVVRVKDGDTILCCFSVYGMQPKKWCVRLVGFDACEVHTQNKEEKTHGIATKLMLEDRILNEIVQLSFGPADKYGRWLATVHHKGESINSWLLKNSSVCPYLGGRKEKDFQYDCSDPTYLSCFHRATALMHSKKK